MNEEKIEEYNKASLSLPEQINLLLGQGLIVDDKVQAEEILSVIGYYRLSGYLLPFKKSHCSNQRREFKSATHFDTIWQLYQFDRELRLLVLDAVEKIEVAFRASIVNNTSNRYGAFWYTENSYYRNQTSYKKIMRQVDSIVKNQEEVFIKHYYEKYNNPEYPPIWMIIETLSFGTCSQLVSSLTEFEVRRSISKIFRRHTTIVESWIRSLTYVRNICAHHGRLWNRWLVNSPIIPNDMNIHREIGSNYKFILIAYVIDDLLSKVSPESQWKERLFSLFEKYESFPGARMGFIDQWQSDPFWINKIV